MGLWLWSTRRDLRKRQQWRRHTWGDIPDRINKRSSLRVLYLHWIYDRGWKGVRQSISIGHGGGGGGDRLSFFSYTIIITIITISSVYARPATGRRADARFLYSSFLFLYFVRHSAMVISQNSVAWLRHSHYVHIYIPTLSAKYNIIYTMPSRTCLHWIAFRIHAPCMHLYISDTFVDESLVRYFLSKRFL